MIIPLSQLYKNLELGVDKVRQLSKNFCEPLNITTFGYVRIYDDGRTSWLTSNPEQDRFLVESGALNKDPLIDTKKALKDGYHLYFHERKFPDSESFYRERARRFQIDHGMVVVKHHEGYLETFCFSGLASKQPLYHLFMNEQPLFDTFIEHFKKQLDRRLSHLLEQGIFIGDLKKEFGQSIDAPIQHLKNNKKAFLSACGWKNLLLLSRREKECLALLRKGYSYSLIGSQLKLSQRTVEHYIDSVKNKLGVDTRSELYLAAEKLALLD